MRSGTVLLFKLLWIEVNLNAVHKEGVRHTIQIKELYVFTLQVVKASALHSIQHTTHLYSKKH